MAPQCELRFHTIQLGGLSVSGEPVVQYSCTFQNVVLLHSEGLESKKKGTSRILTQTARIVRVRAFEPTKSRIRDGADGFCRKPIERGLFSSSEPVFSGL